MEIEHFNDLIELFNTDDLDTKRLTGPIIIKNYRLGVELSRDFDDYNVIIDSNASQIRAIALAATKLEEKRVKTAFGICKRRPGIYRR